MIKYALFKKYYGPLEKKKSTVPPNTVVFVLSSKIVYTTNKVQDGEN